MATKKLQIVGSLGGQGSQVQADFAQNDSTQPDYIKNRIAYENGTITTTILQNQSLDFYYESDMEVYISEIELSADDVSTWTNLSDITVLWDGVEYILNKTVYGNMLCWGNLMVLGLESSGDPFFIYADICDDEGYIGCFSFNDATPDDTDNAPIVNHTIEVSCQKDSVFVDPKYFNIENMLTVHSGDIIVNKAKYILEEIDEGIYGMEAEGFLHLPASNKVCVHWGDVEYICDVQYIEGMCAIGNIGLMLGDETLMTDDPFIIVTDGAAYYMIYSFDENPICEFYITAVDEFSSKIDGKFLSVNMTTDDYPEKDSDNLITSGAVHWALGGKSSIQTAWGISEYDDGYVTSRQIYQAFGNKSTVEMDVDDTVNAWSSKPVSSQAVHQALSSQKVNTDSTIVSGSSNPVSGGAVYNELTQYYTKTEIDNNYYTKSELDTILGDVDVILNQLDVLIGE